MNPQPFCFSLREQGRVEDPHKHWYLGVINASTNFQLESWQGEWTWSPPQAEVLTLITLPGGVTSENLARRCHSAIHIGICTRGSKLRCWLLDLSQQAPANGNRKETQPLRILIAFFPCCLRLNQTGFLPCATGPEVESHCWQSGTAVWTQRDKEVVKVGQSSLYLMGLARDKF